MIVPYLKKKANDNIPRKTDSKCTKLYVKNYLTISKFHIFTSTDTLTVVVVVLAVVFISIVVLIFAF